VFGNRVLKSIFGPKRENSILKRFRTCIAYKIINNVKLSLCHEDVCGSGCIDPCILDLGTSWR
jgi:hypothetical protein